MIPPAIISHQINQRLLLVMNMLVGGEKNTKTTKSAVHPEGGSRNPRLFMGIIGRSSSTQMAGLGGSFQYGDSNFMVAESLEEY